MIAGLILAAGQVKRVGHARPLMVAEQASLLDAVLRACRAAALDDLVVVLGAEARRIVQHLSLSGLKIVINNQHRMGLASSLQRGLAYIPSRFRAVMVALGDMPLISPATINQLIAEYRKGKKGIVVPVHRRERGYPIIIDLKHLEFLLGLRGDSGAPAVADAFPKDVRTVPVDSDEVLVDVDTHDDWQRVRARLIPPPPVPVLT